MSNYKFPETLSQSISPKQYIDRSGLQLREFEMQVQRNLICLNLSFNKLSSIPDVFCPNLMSLFLNNNVISHLDYAHFQQLEILHLHNNPVITYGYV